MKLNEIPKEDLELMGYDDIAYIVLKEAGKKMKLVDIFKKVCKALELPSNIVNDHLLEFFEQMSTNKKFVMLDKGYWDLQSRHEAKFVIEDDENIDEPLEDEYEDDQTEEEDDDDIDDDVDSDDDTDDDGLEDLVIIDSDEEE